MSTATIDTDPRLPNLPTEEEVIEHYEYITHRFSEEHALHTLSWDEGSSLTRRSYGACLHLRDQILAAAREDIGSISAHLWSNMMHTRLCLACSRQAQAIERTMCGTCGHPNPHQFDPVKGRWEWRLSARKCAVNVISRPPLLLHLPLCYRCERFIARYEAHRVVLSPNPLDIP